MSLATYRRNGVEVKTPVWIAEKGGLYYVFSAGDAGKVKENSSDTPSAARCMRRRGNLRSDWTEAQARIVSDPALIAEVRKALRSKYGLVMGFADVMATMTGRIRPTCLYRDPVERWVITARNLRLNCPLGSWLLNGVNSRSRRTWPRLDQVVTSHPIAIIVFDAVLGQVRLPLRDVISERAAIGIGIPHSDRRGGVR